MELSELSYGNYIRKKDDKTIWKVVGIDNTGEIKCHNGEVVEQHQIAEYEGVFASPDILTICGWDVDSMHARILTREPNYYAQYYFYGGELSLYRTFKDERRNTDFYCISAPGLNYIHELQNFLKLAIPEKELITIKLNNKE